MAVTAMGWLVTQDRFLKPSGSRFVFFMMGAAAFVATEFGRHVYRPLARQYDIRDFGLADSIGNMGGIVVQIFLSLALLNATRRQSYRLATFFALGYVLYEFVQPVLPRGMFDWKDVYGTAIGWAFSLIVLAGLWRMIPGADGDPEDPAGARKEIPPGDGGGA